MGVMLLGWSQTSINDQKQEMNQVYDTRMNKIWLVIIIIILLFVCCGTSLNRYGYVGGGVKFIQINAKAYVNVSHIVSVRKVSDKLSPAGQTEISTVNGNEYYVDESMDYIIDRIIER